jgi:hypothetical protein
VPPIKPRATNIESFMHSEMIAPHHFAAIRLRMIRTTCGGREGNFIGHHLAYRNVANASDSNDVI